MAVIVKELVPTMQIDDTADVRYAPISCRAILDKCTVYNSQAANINLIMQLDGVRIIERSIAPDETYLCPEIIGHVLDAGHSLQASQDSGLLGVYLRVSGREITGI